MNSRSAKNETSANNTMAPISPDNQPIQNTITMNQLLRSKVLACTSD